MSNVTDLRAKTLDELKAYEVELLQEQFNLRMQRGSQQLSKNHLFKIVRRNIARVKTIMAEKQRGGEQS